MRRSAAIGVALAVMLLAACESQSRKNGIAATGGDPSRGVTAISHYGCGSCHTIPGVAGAHGLVGPPLAGIGARLYVAGQLPNTAANLMSWIRNPVRVNEKTIMPELGVTAEDAKDIAAYLYSMD